jgi:hypothetical protein
VTSFWGINCSSLMLLRLGADIGSTLPPNFLSFQTYLVQRGMNALSAICLAMWASGGWMLGSRDTKPGANAWA